MISDDKYLIEQLNFLKLQLQLLDVSNYLKSINRRNRTCYMRPNHAMGRTTGYYVTTFLQDKLNDSCQFFTMTRMNVDSFHYFLILLAPHVHKDPKKHRYPVLPEERIALTLIYLAQGAPMKYLASSWHLGNSTVIDIINTVCKIIWINVGPIYIYEPSKEDFNRIAVDFENLWNLPNCIGAIDGKHVNIKRPPNSGSQYFNYKKTYSIALMAACDAKYNFTYVDFGGFGSQHDSTTFQNSEFGRAILNNALKLPEPKFLQNSQIMFNHYFVADAAFPLKLNLLRPISGKNLSKDRIIYNYRISRARRTIENTFGIMVSRWRILQTVLPVQPTNAQYIVGACIVLHNFMMTSKTTADYCPAGYVDVENEAHEVEFGQWRQYVHEPLSSLELVTPNRNAKNAIEARDKMVSYVNNEGAVPFQWAMLG